VQETTNFKVNIGRTIYQSTIIHQADINAIY
jgi:hypothetical protein